VLPYAGAVQAALGPAGAALLVAGGVAYSVGGVIYAARWPDPVPKRAPAACLLPGRRLRRCRAQPDACTPVIAFACACEV
jgi:predicted membrane channel-forming protein YqfA (hemolysin III family)